MERLNSIMNGDSNRDPAAYMDAMVEAFTEASQNPMNNFMGTRAHAPSGFELESNLEDIYALMELRSSVAGKQDEEGSDDEYVKLSQYEVDFDVEDINKMSEQQHGVNEENKEPSEAEMYNFNSPNIHRKMTAGGQLNRF